MTKLSNEDIDIVQESIKSVITDGITTSFEIVKKYELDSTDINIVQAIMSSYQAGVEATIKSVSKMMKK